MGFLKYQEDRELRQGNGRGPVSFARANVDGVPFRGNYPLLRNDEFDVACETVNDANVRLLDVSIPEDLAVLQDVIDKAANDWYRIVLFRDRWVKTPEGTDTLKILLAWIVPHKELNPSRVPFANIPVYGQQ